MRVDLRRAQSLALSLALVLSLTGCASRRSAEPVDWSAGDVIGYRLVTKADFRSNTSNSTWGNFAHGAEICTHILPAADYERTGAFRAVMKQECSFWNKVIGPAGFLGRIAGLLFGVPVMVPVKQPDAYILQHEQVHFAIMQVAALKLSQQVGQLPPSRRTRDVAGRLYAITLSQAGDRHRDFDQETSGSYRPDQLEKWVRILERQMEELCGGGDRCPVRSAVR